MSAPMLLCHFTVIVSNTGQAIQWDYDMHGSASFDAVTAKWM
jgi:hypothetical protein